LNIIILDASETARIKVEELLNDINIDSHNIQSFENSNEALEYIEDSGVDLIISSVELAGMDGVSFVDMIL
jgi:two-component SAPR family response regulator